MRPSVAEENNTNKMPNLDRNSKKNTDKKLELHCNFIRFEDSTMRENFNVYLDIVSCHIL